VAVMAQEHIECERRAHANRPIQDCMSRR
jgi:hypothetical protein